MSNDLENDRASADARQWAEAHVRFTSQIHGKKGITWTAHLKAGSLVFERSASGEVRYGSRLKARASAEVIQDFLEHGRHVRG
jgi:hypothetical protein